MKNIHISKNLEALSLSFADWIVAYAEEILKKKETFSIVLSGGNTPKKLHEILVSEPFRSKISWGKWHFFLGDERFVPITEERSNEKMIYETLLNHVPVSAQQIHFFKTEDISPEKSSDDFEGFLKKWTQKNGNLDLVILGMGDDGHTLSLFPGFPIVFENQKWVSSFWLESQKMYRITLTHPVVNNAGKVAFLATGSNKVNALQEVLFGEYNPSLYPSQIIKPISGELHWFLDQDAAKGIAKK